MRKEFPIEMYIEGLYEPYFIALHYGEKLSLD